MTKREERGEIFSYISLGLLFATVTFFVCIFLFEDIADICIVINIIFFHLGIIFMVCGRVLNDSTIIGKTMMWIYFLIYVLIVISFFVLLYQLQVMVASCVDGCAGLQDLP